MQQGNRRIGGRRRRPRQGCVATLLGACLALASAEAAAVAPAPAGEARAGDALECLALNIYHEARGEPLEGQLAVAHVVLNRARDPRFPGDVCEVTYEHRTGFGPDCQFSWTCDGISDRPRDPVAWRRSQALARQVYDGLAADPTQGALWFHADYVEPHWSPGERAGQRIGQHIFFRTLGEGGPTRLVRQPAGDEAPRPSGAESSLAPLLAKALLLGGSKAAGLQISVRHSLDPARRSVTINDAVFREGDWAAPGILVETIMPRAIVLSADKGRTKRVLRL